LLPDRDALRLPLGRLLRLPRVHPSSLFGFSRFRGGLPGHIQTDLIPELEAVGHGLGGAVDLDRHAMHFMFLDPEAESAAGKAHQLDGGIVELRLPSLVLDSYPDPVRDLGGEIVELKG